MSVSEAHPRAPRGYRVLLIAEAANPEWASVPLVGWNIYRALAELVDVHLVTQVRNRGAIIRAGLIEGRDFTAIDNEHFAAPIHKLAQRLRGGDGKGWTTATAFSSLAYYSFESELWRLFKSRLSAHEFALVHRVTPLTPTSQSILAKRLAHLGIPFVVGPLNGGVPWPKHFINRQHAEREWLSHIRWIYKFMPAYRSMRRYSAAIIVGSRYTYEEMPDWAKKKCVYIPENGIRADVLKVAVARHVRLPLQGAFVGRLVPYKGADVLLEAAAEFVKTGQVELHIIGDGPQRAMLEKMIQRLGIHNSVHIHGWLPHSETLNKLRDCDFLALPSIREFGGGVVVEAMSQAVTPIVADYAGPSELVDKDTGIRVPFVDKDSLVAGMKLAIGRVIEYPEMLNQLGTAARQKIVSMLTWEAKARQIALIYQAVLSNATNLPIFDFD
jgi:glycosyltransferase involved in cell wall biosynthesis